MRIETSIPEPNAMRSTRQHAFTIMELLVVIAIMAVVAGLIVGLAGVTGDTKKIKRAETELAKLVTLIEDYKAKVGVYPPEAIRSGTNALLFELAGAYRLPPAADPIYETPFGNISSNEIWQAYGRSGLVNAIDKGSDGEDAKVYRILKDIAKDSSDIVAGHPSLVVPIDGPNGRPNPWRYRVGNNATHNKQSFDLWVEIKVRGGIKEIGNWKN